MKLNSSTTMKRKPRSGNEIITKSGNTKTTGIKIKMETITTLSAYQAVALQTAIYPEQGKFGGLVYTVLKLNGEAGEVAEKVGKLIRDKSSIVAIEDREALLKELGDVLWYVTAAANELGSNLAAVANINLQKLALRSAKNMLSGSGDDREQYAASVKEYVTRAREF